MTGHDRYNLEDAERCYDGPIPVPLRLALRHGSARMAERHRAQAEAAFFTSLVTKQLRELRLRRSRGGGGAASLMSDLDLYRRERCRWRRAALESRSPAS